MPTVSAPPLSGAGTFNTAITPALNTPLVLTASGSISVGPTSQGYITADIVDGSGNSVCGIAAIITPADLVAGFKNFNINVSGPQFNNATSLQTSVGTRQLDGADPSTAPVISSANLTSFTSAQEI